MVLLAPPFPPLHILNNILDTHIRLYRLLESNTIICHLRFCFVLTPRTLNLRRAEWTTLLRRHGVIVVCYRICGYPMASKEYWLKLKHITQIKTECYFWHSCKYHIKDIYQKTFHYFLWSLDVAELNPEKKSYFQSKVKDCIFQPISQMVFSHVFDLEYGRSIKLPSRGLTVRPWKVTF